MTTPRKLWFCIKYLSVIFLFFPLCCVEAQVKLHIQFGKMPGDLARPFVQGKTQQQTLNLLFDSGFTTAQIALDSNSLKTIHVVWTHKKSCSINAAGQKKCWDNFILPVLKLQNTTIRNIKGVKLSTEEMNHSVGTFDGNNIGILGLPLIKTFNIKLDYPKRLITLYAKDSQSLPQYKRKIKLIIKHGSIETMNKIHKNQVLLTWDTGAVSSINKTIIPRKLYSQCPDLVNSPIPCYRIRANDEQYLHGTWFFLMPFSNLAPQGFIGSQFFHHHVCVIDFTNQLIMVQPT